MIVKKGDSIAVWFSCGAASAVAAKMTIEKYKDIANIRIINNPIKEEHEDNMRFLRDVEKWLGIEIEFATNPKYPEASVFDVFYKRRYISGVEGAPCTYELKKRARQTWENENSFDWIVFGFTADEIKRHNNFVMSERDNLLPVLIDLGITKSDCYSILARHNIKLPAIYGFGFPNANCIGCVKATSPTYWNLVRKHFPERFSKISECERDIGANLVRYKKKRIQLHQLPADAVGRPLKNSDFECGIVCEEKKPERTKSKGMAAAVERARFDFVRGLSYPSICPYKSKSWQTAYFKEQRRLAQRDLFEALR